MEKCILRAEIIMEAKKRNFILPNKNFYLPTRQVSGGRVLSRERDIIGYVEGLGI